jgi:hypothetical protein
VVKEQVSKHVSLTLLSTSNKLLMALSNTTSWTCLFCSALLRYEYIFLGVNDGLQWFVTIAKCDYLLFLMLQKCELGCNIARVM